jgi:hypothetical protein
MFKICKPCALQMIKSFDKLLKITETVRIKTEWNDLPEQRCDYQLDQERECMDIWNEEWWKSVGNMTKKK